MAGFTLLEMLISMALISIVISIAVDSSGSFEARLQAILFRTDKEIHLRQLTLYLNDLYRISDVVQISESKADFYKSDHLIAICDQESSEFACTFDPDGIYRNPKKIPIFNLADQGYLSAHFKIKNNAGNITETVGQSASDDRGITFYVLELHKPNQLGSTADDDSVDTNAASSGFIGKTISFGILPGISSSP